MPFGEAGGLKPDDEHYALIARATRGVAEATDFLVAAFQIAHFWDDLVDRDKPMSREDIYDAMWQVLVRLPRNNFYRAHFTELNPILAQAIINWSAANAMEDRPAEGALPIAFVLRSSYVDLIGATALICGGLRWAQSITLEARRLWHNETTEDYLAGLHTERRVLPTVKVEEFNVV